MQIWVSGRKHWEMQSLLRVQYLLYSLETIYTHEADSWLYSHMLPWLSWIYWLHLAMVSLVSQLNVSL